MKKVGIGKMQEILQKVSNRRVELLEKGSHIVLNLFLALFSGMESRHFEGGLLKSGSVGIEGKTELPIKGPSTVKGLFSTTMSDGNGVCDTNHNVPTSWHVLVWMSGGNLNHEMRHSRCKNGLINRLDNSKWLWISRHARKEFSQCFLLNSAVAFPREPERIKLLCKPWVNVGFQSRDNSKEELSHGGKLGGGIECAFLCM